MYFLWQCPSYLPNYLSFGACWLSLSVLLSLLSLSLSPLRNQTVAHSFLLSVASHYVQVWILAWRGTGSCGPTASGCVGGLGSSEAVGRHHFRSSIRLFSIHHVRIWTGDSETPVFVLLFGFDVRAMFGPLVASHFICDFRALKTGTVLPDVNADCFPSRCKLQIYFPVEEKRNSLFSFCELYFGLSRVFFQSVENLGDAKLERAHSGAACTVTLEKSGTANVFLVGRSLPHPTTNHLLLRPQILQQSCLIAPIWTRTRAPQPWGWETLDSCWRLKYPELSHLLHSSQSVNQLETHVLKLGVTRATVLRYWYGGSS